MILVIILILLLKDAKLKKEDIHEIILNGGNSNIPIIQQIIKDYFNRKETITLNPGIHFLSFLSFPFFH